MPLFFAVAYALLSFLWMRILARPFYCERKENAGEGMVNNP
jgi:hypothetical protein